MEQFKFTAAPWRFLYGRTPEDIERLKVLTPNGLNKSWEFKEIDIGDSDGRLIAKISAGTLDSHVPFEQFEANAKLIAAAPSLLLACINVFGCLANAPERQHEKDTLIAAINKATK